MKKNYHKCLNFLLSVLTLLIVAATAAAQSAQSAPTLDCPIVTVSSPDSVPAGQTLAFAANVSGGGGEVTPTFNWTISAGTIGSGQGTSMISVETAGLENQTVTATVDVGGYGRACSASSSSTTAVGKKIDPRKIDEYVVIESAGDIKRLDAFALELKNDPAATGYIIAYGGRQSDAGEGQKMADAAGDYLVNKYGFNDGRVLVGVGGYREKPTVELWLAPAGASPPMATPTVDPSEVTPGKKPKPAVQKKRPGRQRNR